jgi:hypothetical protein
MAGEEKQSLIMELDNNHLKLQELSDEYARLMNECKNYLSFKHNPTVPPGKPLSQESVMQAQQKLLLRIEELEDLVIELKNQQRPTEIIDMKTILLSKEQEIQLLTAKNEELRKHKINSKNLFE